ncbi:pre-mRNA-splicing factor prp46 [Dipsacomyces acuminosporus]|nr:pre-mRNA-splicing factor prp46 [Dipsacomyces acuminosporus]
MPETSDSRSPSVLALASARSTRSLFTGSSALKDSCQDKDDKSQAAKIAAKYRDEYLSSRELPRGIEQQNAKSSESMTATVPVRSALPNYTIATNGSSTIGQTKVTNIDDEVQKVIDGLAGRQSKAKAKMAKAPNRELILAASEKSSSLPPPPGQQIVRKRNYEPIKPEWHAPWKLMRVISGHIGWVRSLAVEPGNKWFASGSVDRTIKIWDLASGTLKLTLTGHISPVRGLAVSPRHPYLFSCGEDKQVKCWDLETNKVVRHYHGHLSGVYSLALHPVLDLLVTGGRDSVARVWDMRTRQQVHVLAGHKSTISTLQCQEADPQADKTIKIWKEDEDATEESHPIQFKPSLGRRRF